MSADARTLHPTIKTYDASATLGRVVEDRELLEQAGIETDVVFLPASGTGEFAALVRTNADTMEDAA